MRTPNNRLAIRSASSSCHPDSYRTLRVPVATRLEGDQAVLPDTIAPEGATSSVVRAVAPTKRARILQRRLPVPLSLEPARERGIGAVVSYLTISLLSRSPLQRVAPRGRPGHQYTARAAAGFYQ